ncbi:hypothetical protein IQ247_09780 [Plectonema cf. radiosum LEGE 06105]|uniref:Uncharacterized protein n=1 Tax=Plectonema cf. radiosum LEGE 06105 TaxID=945769 RepID=A0A8J7JZW8_9CYAN|nr:hypothetical protein [Plectonema radiosum]MBE9212971.1 hypothetical protein [Plectonema cf. radiosum LEGE 06105]
MSQILDLLSGLVGGDEDKPEPATVLEQLEQENSKNVTERHQLTAEKEYEASGHLAQYGQQLAVAVTVNSAITFGLLTAIDGLTLGFNPILFYLLCGGVNTSTSVLTIDKKLSRSTNLMLGGSKFVINMSVNGQLIGQMTDRVGQSNATVTSIQQSIKDYEAGFKQQPNYWGYVGLAIAIAAIIAFIFGRGK